MYQNCTVASCGNPVFSSGLCRKHYEKDWLAKAGPCSFEGCRAPGYRAGLCSAHYRKKVAEQKPPCEVPGCSDLQVAKGLCQKHYYRLRTNGAVDNLRAADWGSRESHPLHSRWASQRREKRLCDEWQNDFWAFVEVVGHPPAGHTLRKIDPSRPLGPSNFVWREPLQKEKGSWYKQAAKLRPEVLKNNYLKKHYGITLQEYERMYAAQEGKCAICGGKENTKDRDGGPRSMPVDHCHKTGRVRSLLCTHCNRGLGMFRESPEALRKAAQYIELHEKERTCAR